MWSKIKEFFNFKKLGNFFTGLFNISSYSEHTRAVSDALKDINTSMSQMQEHITKSTAAINSLSDKIDKMDKEISKVKDGLQIELFGSLQSLYLRLKEQKYATIESKREAELFYTQIHNLGKDGWSKYYYEYIMKMPESLAAYWEEKK